MKAQQASREQKLFFVFLLFLALCHFPLLSIFNRPLGVGEWPLLLVYIMLWWAGLILAVYFIMESKPPKNNRE